MDFIPVSTPQSDFSWPFGAPDKARRLTRQKQRCPWPETTPTTKCRFELETLKAKKWSALFILRKAKAIKFLRQQKNLLIGSFLMTKLSFHQIFNALDAQKKPFAANFFRLQIRILPIFRGNVGMASAGGFFRPAAAVIADT